MSRDLDIMNIIQQQKELDIAHDGEPEMDAETALLAEGKRFTFDVVQIPTDPLR